MRRGRRLGIDVGAVRIGLALSDPDGVLATPLRTVPRDGSGAGVDLATILALMAEHDVVGVVVGLPRTLAGREGPAAQAAREFATELTAALTAASTGRSTGSTGASAAGSMGASTAGSTAEPTGAAAGPADAGSVSGVEVVLSDERLTTVVATRRLRGSGVPGRKQRAVIDQAAAVEILQGWLDRSRRSIPPIDSVDRDH